MTFDDVCMINLQIRASGLWSWSAYTTGHVFWRSNTDEESPLDCILGVMACIDEHNLEAVEGAERTARLLSGGSPRSAGASGGIEEKTRAGSGQNRKRRHGTTKTTSNSE
jgi:hypothetical protein